jgi:tetratricopeptide (TPR) repeat protein
VHQTCKCVDSYIGTSVVAALLCTAPPRTCLSVHIHFLVSTVWEIYCTVATGSKFSIALSKSEEEQFTMALHIRSGGTGVDKAFSNIDAARAEAHSPDDLMMIMGAIDSSVGFSEMNSLILEALREWMRMTVRLRITTTTNTLRTLHSPLGDTDPEIASPHPDTPTSPWRSESLGEGDDLFASLEQPPTPIPLSDGAPGSDLDRDWTEWERQLPPALFTADSSQFDTDASAEVDGRTTLPKRKRAPIIDTTQQVFKELIREADALIDLTELKDVRGLYDPMLRLAPHFGEDHPVILVVKSRLAILYHEMGRKADAKVLYEEALEGLTTAFGPEHIDTINTKHNLAVLLSELGGDLDEAKSALVSVIDVLTVIEAKSTAPTAIITATENTGDARGKGSDCSFIDRLGAMTSLADVLTKMGEKTAALASYEEVLRLYATLPGYGPSHRDILMCQHNMGACLAELGETDSEFTRAKCILERVWRRFREILGPDHAQTATARCT